MAGSVADIDRYDCLYISPHAGDAPLSCAARMRSELGRELRVLVVTLFDPPAAPSRLAGALVSEGAAADHVSLGLPEASHRDPSHGSFRSALYARHPADDACVDGAARLLDEVGQRTRARHVYLPLGVGGHIDHRLAHEAGLRVYQSATGRDVFLYEERPYAFVPGAVWVRLGELGAWLPPAAQDVPDGSTLARFMLGVSRAPYLRTRAGWSERLGCARLAARQWRQARAWRPQKALGPRLQPVLHEPTAAHEADTLRAAASGPCGVGAQVERLGAAYGRSIGGDQRSERYWLVLPQRDDGRLVPSMAEAFAPVA